MIAISIHITNDSVNHFKMTKAISFLMTIFQASLSPKHFGLCFPTVEVKEIVFVVIVTSCH